MIVGIKTERETHAGITVLLLWREQVVLPFVFFRAARLLIAVVLLLLLCVVWFGLVMCDLMGFSEMGCIRLILVVYFRLNCRVLSWLAIYTRNVKTTSGRYIPSGITVSFTVAPN